MFSIRSWQIMSCVHWHMLFVSMEMSKRWALLQRYPFSRCFCGGCTQGCSLSSAKPSSWRPPLHSRVDASCLSPQARASTCLWLRLGGARGGGSCMQTTFNFIQMNSWHSKGCWTLRRSSCLEGPAPRAPEGFVVQLEQNPRFILPPLSTSYRFRGEYKRLFPPCTICSSLLKWRLRLFKRGLKQRNPAAFKMFTLIRNSRYKRPSH